MSAADRLPHWRGDFYDSTSLGRRRLMLRLIFLGLLIVLGVGVLSAMELRAPSRGTVAIVQSPAAPDAGSSASPETLAKGDRLDAATVSSETQTQVALADEPAFSSNDARITSPAPSR